MQELTDAGATLLVGTRQVQRAIAEGKTKKVWIARDCDEALKARLLALCVSHNIVYAFVQTKQSLGQACGIEVSAAVAALPIVARE